jgi:transposase
MSSLPVFVGIDYHQDSVQVCVLDGGGKRLVNRSVGNDAAEVARVATRYGRPARVALEACCGAADMADELATTESLPVELAHPGYVARLKRSPDKHDLGDAHLLADLARVNYLPTVWLAPESTRRLRRLVRHRAQLVRRRRDVKLRIRGLLRENRVRCSQAIAWRKAWMEWLQRDAPLADGDRWIVDDHLAELSSLAQRIAAVEASISAATADDPIVAKLLAQPGVGLVTAATMRAEIGRFATGAVLRRHAPERQQRRSPSGRRLDRRGQSRIADRADRTGAPTDQPHQGPVGRSGARHAHARQAQERRRRRRGQSLGAVAASRTAEINKRLQEGDAKRQRIIGFRREGALDCSLGAPRRSSLDRAAFSRFRNTHRGYPPPAETLG